MTEQKEKELVSLVNSTHTSFLNWKRKQKHLQLASDLTSKKTKEKKEKEPSNKRIEFPEECTIPVNHVIPIHMTDE